MLSPALRADIDMKVEMPEEVWILFVDVTEFQMLNLPEWMRVTPCRGAAGSNYGAECHF